LKLPTLGLYEVMRLETPPMVHVSPHVCAIVTSGSGMSNSSLRCLPQEDGLPLFAQTPWLGTKQSTPDGKS